MTDADREKIEAFIEVLERELRNLRAMLDRDAAPPLVDCPDCGGLGCRRGPDRLHYGCRMCGGNSVKIGSGLVSAPSRGGA